MCQGAIPEEQGDDQPHTPHQYAHPKTGQGTPTSFEVRGCAAGATDDETATEARYSRSNGPCPDMNDAGLTPITDQVSRIDFVMLADRAEVCNGKLYVMGGILDRFFVSETPTAINFSVALGIVVPWNATNQPMQVRLSFQTEEGQELGSAEFSATAGRPPHLPQGDIQRMALAIPGINLSVPHLGLYVVLATLGDEQPIRVPFRAVPLGS